MSYEEYGRGGRDYDDRDERYDGPAQQSGEYLVPDVVKSFVVYFYRHIREQNVYEIHQMYEGTFNKLTERMFTQNSWPPAEAIAKLVDNDHVFLLLYRELYYRHLYAKLQPTLEQRIESWDNYCQLFQVILHGNVNMQLPNLWLWDMIDEFIYQFQSFCQFRAKLRARTDEELDLLRKGDQWWNVYGVLNYLQALIEKSEIVQILDEEAEGRGNFTATDGYDHQGGSNVLKVLGYFSIIGLLRVHCLLGDYQSALQRLTPIDIARPGIFHRVIGCQITTMYYCGFASMMMRRYTDAISAFNVVLIQLLKHKDSLEGLPQFDQVLKKNEQMFALLAICLALCPQGKLVEENVNNQLREKYGEKMLRMQRGDEVVFDELFSFACPKFITPSPPTFDEGPLVNFNQDAYRLQLKLFLAEVRQQQPIFNIRTLLKLYTTISIPRMASLMDMDEVALRTALLTYKQKTHTVDAYGIATSHADVDFYIDDDIVLVSDSKGVRRYGDYFVKHVARFDDIVSELEQVRVD